MAKGHLRRLTSTAVAARLLLENVAFWAVHRHWDASLQAVSEVHVKATVIDMLVRSVVAGASQEKP